MKDINYNDLDIFQDLNNSHKSETISEFMEYLCLCNNVSVNVKTHVKKEIIKGHEDEGEIISENSFTEKKFNSSVAEERALLKTLKYFGFSIDKVNQKEITINIDGKSKVYYILGRNRYTESKKPSDMTRNRMSVILRAHKHEKESILLCKGNDLSIMEKLKITETKSEKFIRTMIEQIQIMANNGLRYFIFCKKKLNEQETNEFLSKYKLAENYVLQKEILFENVNNE